MGWERRQRRDGTGDGEEKTNEREHCFALARPSTTAGPGPSRLNAVKLSSYSHKGNSLSQPVKYKRVFPAGRFSTPIVFWAGLLFSVALRRATLPTIISTNNDDCSLLLVRLRAGRRERANGPVLFEPLGGETKRTDGRRTLREGTPTIYDRTEDRSRRVAE